MIKKKTTKRKAKRYVPSFVITDGKVTYVYKLDHVVPMTKKKVELLDKAIQDKIASGQMTTSLAYVQV